MVSLNTYSNLLHWYITLTYSTMFRLKHVAIIGPHTKGRNMPTYIIQKHAGMTLMVLHWYIPMQHILIHAFGILQITRRAFVTTENFPCYERITLAHAYWEKIQNAYRRAVRCNGVMKLPDFNGKWRGGTYQAASPAHFLEQCISKIVTDWGPKNYNREAKSKISI
jgi:hypothetical protein